MLTNNQVDALFPNGLKVRVRTGRKNADGKHITEALPVTPETWADEFLAIVIESGCRAIVAEKLNTIATEGGAKLAEARVLFAQADRGELPSVCVRRPSGGTSSDPILVEAIKLARADVLTALKAVSMVKAAETEGGRKYFNVSASGAVSDNVEAFESFIKANAGRKYMERAKAIVDARLVDEDEAPAITL